MILAGVASALAAPAWAADGKPVPLAKAFGYLDGYWKLPASQRAHFAPAYYFRENGAPMASGRLTIVDSRSRTPLALAADGRALRLPSLAQLQAATVEGESVGKGKIEVRLELHATCAPAARLEAQELELAIGEARAAVARLAGALAFAAPKIASADFPGSGSGEAILVSGAAARLPIAKGAPFYNPVKLRGARTIALDHAPAKILLGSNA
jgi:hypothetical protein